MTQTISTDAVARHYSAGGLLDRVADNLRAAGFPDGAAIPVDALAPLDQFHTRGLEATIELAALAGAGRDMRVLDVGSGIGGPARHLAAHHGCRVTGVDLTDDFVQVARYLSERTGLADRVAFQTADATRLPFEAERFDLVWCQHVVMNIADRPALYREMHRVLRPGGRLATYDVVEGPGGPLHYPVPWADDESQTHLLTAEATQAALGAAGFRIAAVRDATPAALAAIAKGPPPAPPRITLAQVMRSGFGEMIANHGRNLREDRVRLAMFLGERG